MARRVATLTPLERAATAFITVAVVACLYLGKVVLLPLALAILSTFLLAPAAARIERLGCRRVPAVLIVAVLVAGFVALLATLTTVQLVSLAKNLPEYRANVAEKIDSLGGRTGGSIQYFLSIVSDLKSLQQDGGAGARGRPPPDDEAGSTVGGEAPTAPAPESHGTDGPREAPPPVPVSVVDNSLNPLELLRDWLGPLLSPLATVGIVTVFTTFMLIQREDLRNRIVMLLGADRLLGTTQILDEAAALVSRYLRANLLLNVSYGFAVTIFLYALGMPTALLWGLLAGVLRFVPFVGPMIGAAMPALVSLAVFDGWTRPLVVVGLFVSIELIWNNVLEPLAYGASSGLSTMGVLVSALFWAWLWGGAGLILATPLTVCITVLGRHFPQFRFLDLLLSARPSIPREAVLYQRLLAEDQDEAADLVDEYLKDHTVPELFDGVLLAALSLAEIDRHHGRLDAEQVEFIQQELRALVADVSDRASPTDKIQEPSSARTPVNVLCVPARDSADEVAAEMLAESLRREGHMAEVMSHKALAGEMIQHFQSAPFDLAVISALPPQAITHTRYVCARFRAARPKVRIIVGLWQAPDVSAKTRERLQARGADKVVRSFAEALAFIEQETPALHSARVFERDDDINADATAPPVSR